MNDFAAIATVLLVFVPLVGLVGWAAVKNLLLIAGPNEVLIFSGPSQYKLVKGGRRLRIPLFETVAHMDLTNMTVDVSVENAYSRGGIPLNVNGVANLKVAGHEPILGQALERFLNQPREAIIRVAKDTLEGNLRGVLSQLSPEEVNNDKIAFAEKLLEEAEHDLAKLGLVLDVLKIQNVSDDVGYLDSIGRKTSAALDKRAKIAEADARAEAMIQHALARQKSRLAECEAEIEIARAETVRRVADAQTRRAAMVADEVGKVAAMVAKAQADLQVQEARVEQVRRQLAADTLASASADMEAKQADARGKASRITEEGRATAAVLTEMIRTWRNSGENARDIFLMEKLEKVMSTLVGTIGDMRVDRVTVLPSGGGRAASAATLVEELKASIGVDLPAIVQGLTQSNGNNSVPAEVVTTQPQVPAVPPAEPSGN